MSLLIIRRGAAAILLLMSPALVSGALAGASANGTSGTHEPIDDPIPGHIADGAIQLELQTVAEGAGLTAPNWGTYAPGLPAFLFVVDQDGPLWAVDTRTGAKNLFLDTSSLLVPIVREFDERGFLGAAFSPDYAETGLLYTMTSEPIPGTASTIDQQPNHLATVRRWVVPDPLAEPLSRPPLPGTGTPILQVEEPQFNHNGGALFFGRAGVDDHLLYITLGDGGCADDQQGQLGLAGEGPCISHEGGGNAQNDASPLGKILRMDPRGGAPEIFASGFRNPFRASADRLTGEIWTADVGQNDIEEVDGPVLQGQNYGWRVKEGTFLFDPDGFELFGFASDGFVFADSPGSPGNLVDPVAQYDHDEGVAVIGGFVYRGTELPVLHGRYVFGDYSDGFFSGNGRVMYVDETDVADPERRTPKVFNLVSGHLNVFVLGLGEDAAGELYVLANKTGGPDRETGLVMKLVATCAPEADCRN